MMGAFSERLIEFLLVLLLISVPTQAFAEKGLTLRERLDKGEIVKKNAESNERRVQATVTAVVDAPPEDVWAIVSDCARYAETMYRIAESKLLEKKGNHWICEVTVGVPGPLPNLTAVTDAVHTVTSKRWERKWTLIRGDYHENRGSWVLGPFNKEGTRTLVVYRASVKPKIAVPDAILKWAQKSSATEVFLRLRKEVAKYRAGKSAK
tara:strand:- start:135 stop:758 length:624 start_codon:yes stop_codon:yes gene_type:complete